VIVEQRGVCSVMAVSQRRDFSDPSMEKQNKAARRVLIVQSGSVLEDGVESLLSQQPDLKVVSVQ